VIALLLCLAAFAAGVVLVPLGLLLVGALLLDERPERFLTEPAARRLPLLRA
jgi:hypothetical protein